MVRTEIVDPSVIEIQTAARHAMRSVHRTMAMVQVTIGRIVRAGTLMRQYRERHALQHGQWMAWLEEHLPDVSYRTAHRWIRLSEFAETKGADLDKAQSVRQAYQLAGLLPESEAGQGGGGSQAGNYLVHVARLERAIRAQVAARPIEQWSNEDRVILRQRLQPIAELYERL